MRHIGLKLALFCTAVGLGSCMPPDFLDIGNWLNGGDEQVAGEGAQCHSGIFECADGPDVAQCGTWYFDMNGDETITGQGEIALPNGTVTVTLSGVIDQGVETYDLVLTSEAGGEGEIHLTYDGPELYLSGSWSFVDAPEPEGTLIEGGLTGTSCTDLRQ